MSFIGVETTMQKQPALSWCLSETKSLFTKVLFILLSYIAKAQTKDRHMVVVVSSLDLTTIALLK